MDIRKIWLSQVAKRHSGSKDTERIYLSVADQYEKVIGIL